MKNEHVFLQWKAFFHLQMSLMIGFKILSLPYQAQWMLFSYRYCIRKPKTHEIMCQNNTFLHVDTVNKATLSPAGTTRQSQHTFLLNFSNIVCYVRKSKLQANLLQQLEHHPFQLVSSWFPPYHRIFLLVLQALPLPQGRPWLECAILCNNIKL